MRPIRLSNKLAQSRPEGTWGLRVFHRKAEGRRDPRYLIKCGCCEERLEIYYGGDTLEVNGVMGSVKNWREILLPLLRVAPVVVPKSAEGALAFGRKPMRSTRKPAARRPAGKLSSKQLR